MSRVISELSAISTFTDIRSSSPWTHATRSRLRCVQQRQPDFRFSKGGAKKREHRTQLGDLYRFAYIPHEPNKFGGATSTRTVIARPARRGGCLPTRSVRTDRNRFKLGPYTLRNSITIRAPGTRIEQRSVPEAMAISANKASPIAQPGKL